MGKNDRLQCEAMTKSGKRCSRKAYKGELVCGLHGGGKITKPKKKSRARIGGIDDSSFHPHFVEILKLCREQIANPTEKGGMLAQWARLQLDAVRQSLEHQRILDGIGDGVKYVAVTQAPDDKPKPPVDSDTPLKSGNGGDSEEERVLN